MKRPLNKFLQTNAVIASETSAFLSCLRTNVLQCGVKSAVHTLNDSFQQLCFHSTVWLFFLVVIVNWHVFNGDL